MYIVPGGPALLFQQCPVPAGRRPELCFVPKTLSSLQSIILLNDVPAVCELEVWTFCQEGLGQWKVALGTPGQSVDRLIWAWPLFIVASVKLIDVILTSSLPQFFWNLA